MKGLLISIFLFFSVGVWCQTNYQSVILKNFISAHNDGSEKAIEKFIVAVYHPTLLQKIDLKKHVEFYTQIVKEFGPLNPNIYETVINSEFQLVVQLIKKNESILNKEIPPTDILVVKIDLHESDSKFIRRGLGLGALVCELKR